MLTGNFGGGVYRYGGNPKPFRRYAGGRGYHDTHVDIHITMVAVRIPLAYGIAYLTRTPSLPYGRYECIWISILCSWVLGAAVTLICCRIGKWEKKALN